jgi:hypothetical protein
VEEKIVEMLAFGEKVVDEEKPDADAEKGQGVGCFQILKSSEQRIKLVLFMLVWLGISVIYYGIAFNTKNLGGSPYINLVYMGLVEVIGFPTAIFASKWYY